MANQSRIKAQAHSAVSRSVNMNVWMPGSCHVQERFTFTLDVAIASHNSWETIAKDKAVIQLSVSGRYKLVRYGGAGGIFNIGEAVYIRHIKPSAPLSLFVEEVCPRLKVQTALPRYPHLRAE